MSRYEHDPDYLPDAHRQSRHVPGNQSGALSFDSGEFDTSRLAQFTNALDRVLNSVRGLQRLKDDLSSKDSSIRKSFNEIDDIEEVKEAVVFFLNKIPQTERVFSDNSALARLFAGTAGKRVANIVKQKFRNRFLAVSAIEERIHGEAQWTVNSFHQMLKDTNQHFGSNTEIAFNVFVNAVKPLKKVCTKGGIQQIVPEFANMAKDDFRNIVAEFAKLGEDTDNSQADAGARARGGARASSGAEDPWNFDTSELVEGSENNEDSSADSRLGRTSDMQTRQSAVAAGPREGGSNPIPGNIAGISDANILASLRERERDNFVYSFCQLRTLRGETVHKIVEDLEWKESDSAYWHNFNNFMKDVAHINDGYMYKEAIVDDIVRPLIIIQYSPVNASPFKITIDCRMVVSMIAPFLFLGDAFKAQKTYNFVDSEQTSAVNFFTAILNRNDLWMEIQAWCKCGRPYLAVNPIADSLSSFHGADSALLSSIMLTDASLQSSSMNNLAAGPTSAAGSTSAAGPSSVAASTDAGAPVVVSADPVSAGVCASDAGSIDAAAQPGAEISTVLASDAAASTTVVSSDSTLLAASDRADAGPMQVSGRIVGQEDGEMQIESGERRSGFSLLRSTKRRREQDNDGEDLDIMDVIGSFNKSYNDLQQCLVKVLNDDGTLTAFREDLESEILIIDNLKEQLLVQKKEQEKLCDQARAELAVIKTQAEEHERRTIELRQAQEISRQRLEVTLNSFLELSGDFSSLINDNIADTKMSLELYETKADGIKTMNVLSRDAKIILDRVQNDIIDKKREESELNSRLESLRGDVSGFENRMEALVRDEGSAKGRIQQLEGEENAVATRVAAAKKEEEAVLARVEAAKAEEEAVLARVAAAKAEVASAKGEQQNLQENLGELRTKIAKSNVSLQNIQDYLREYPKLVAWQDNLRKREEALLRNQTSALMPSTPLGSRNISAMADLSIPRVGQTLDEGAAGGDGSSPSDRLELGPGESSRPGSIH